MKYVAVSLTTPAAEHRGDQHGRRDGHRAANGGGNEVSYDYVALSG